MEWLKGLVQVARNVRYQILSTDRVQAGRGTLVSRTELEQFEARVSIYDQGMVVIESPRGVVEYDLTDGNIVVS